MNFKINEQGYIVTTAKMASIEPMEYLGAEIGQSPADAVFKVFRNESEVFSEATIKSFEGQPLTLTHPDEEVNAKNWKDSAIGHIQNVRREGNYLVADVFINDSDAIEIIKEHGIKEVSCGYDSILVKREGKIYQTQIRGNHLAVVSQGRAGKECKLGDSKKPKQGDKMKFTDRIKKVLEKAKTLKDSEEVKAEELKEQNADVIELLQEALSSAEAMNAELETAKSELADLKKAKDSDTAEPTAEVADLKAKIEALEKENAELKAEIERLKEQADTKEAIADAKANFSHVKLSDTKNARAVYSAVIVDSKAFELSELERLSDGEIKALYLGLKASKRQNDTANANGVINKLFDSGVKVRTFDGKFGGKK
ncbi:DUF2213 domain-containing protein [Campylobacter sp. 9BO]|uniref:DUF2213 domain-containing protein n=1 Tax=Campylobacter sp. 9BO TaxID=3424759 RepID=UPI003D32E263